MTNSDECHVEATTQVLVGIEAAAQYAEGVELVR
jgi:hypothetical protein